MKHPICTPSCRPFNWLQKPGFLWGHIHILCWISILYVLVKEKGLCTEKKHCIRMHQIRREFNSFLQRYFIVTNMKRYKCYEKAMRWRIIGRKVISICVNWTVYNSTFLWSPYHTQTISRTVLTFACSGIVLKWWNGNKGDVGVLKDTHDMDRVCFRQN